VPKDMPSMAKNKMRRCFAAILDPHPTKSEVQKLWEYFSSCCAYCGIAIELSSRTGHIDHAVSSSGGGGNGIHNHVLSCSRCNGDEKREESWESFLERKCQNQTELAERKQRILKWLGLAKRLEEVSPEAQMEAKEVESAAIEAFETAVEKLRKIRAAKA